MIITFGQQKGGVGKTTLAIAFANYLTLVLKKKVIGYDFDFQRSFYKKWKNDENLNNPLLYEVFYLDEDTYKNTLSFDILMEMKKSEVFYIFDLAGTLNENYTDILTFSDYVIVPFEYSDVSIESTSVFINILGQLETSAQIVFVKSRYEQGYNYKNQEDYDQVIVNYGKLINAPIYKRNILQSITTRSLNYKERYAVEETFKEIIQYINETY